MKLISNQLSPNLLWSDALYALTQIPFIGSNKPLKLEHIFCSKNYTLLNSARSGLGLIADIVQPDPNKKVALPAFICGVVATPFLERGYDIEWIDTLDNGTIDPDDFAAKAQNVSLVVVPHIFGQAAHIKQIKTIAEKNDIFVVKDGAHRWDTDLDDCDALILSFGREKVISCVSGGALLWNEHHKTFPQYQTQTEHLPNPSALWTIKHLLHPFWFSVALPIWNIGPVPIGKGIIHMIRKLGILPLAVSCTEKKGQEDLPIQSLPLPQQRILQKQFQQKQSQEQRQHTLALAWEKGLQPLYPKNHIIVPDNGFRTIMICQDELEKKQIQQKAKQHNILLQDWDGIPISPSGVDLPSFGYEPKQCPSAEEVAQNILTFPTNKRTHLKDIERFCTILAA